MALDTLYTSATYNAFTDVAGMDAIMTEFSVLMDNSFWTALADPAKEQLIIFATSNENTKDWIGERNENIVVTEMEWPRTGIDTVSDTVVPTAVIRSMACWISQNAVGSALNTAGTGDVASRSVGEVNVSYNAGSSGSINSAESACSGYASEYLYSSGSLSGVGSVRKTRG